MMLRTALLALALAAVPLAAQAESAVTIPPPAAEAPAQNSGLGSGLETAVLAGGCFWGIQAVYQHVNGVKNAVSGYAGGAQKDAYYQTVSSGRTTHAEAVQVTFDPKQISYGKILQIYFSVAHDPTQLNRQGPDAGPQYRSEIFPQSEAQAEDREGLHRAARCGESLEAPDRDQDRHDEGDVLRGRGLSPGLRDPAPLPALHRLQRQAEGREPEEDVSGCLARSAGAGAAG